MQSTVSLRYDHATFFPQSEDANFDMVGEAAGLGFNVNIPFNGRKMGDSEYMMAFQSVVLPIAYEFQPELVLVSAGFDAAKGDPLGGFRVSSAMFGHMTHGLLALAEGRLVLCLEGGYCLPAISEAVVQCARALLGDPLPPLR
jgi:histone deacetylase 6